MFVSFYLWPAHSKLGGRCNQSLIRRPEFRPESFETEVISKTWPYETIKLAWEKRKGKSKLMPTTCQGNLMGGWREDLSFQTSAANTRRSQLCVSWGFNIRPDVFFYLKSARSQIQKAISCLASASFYIFIGFGEILSREGGGNEWNGSGDRLLPLVIYKLLLLFDFFLLVGNFWRPS